MTDPDLSELDAPDPADTLAQLRAEVAQHAETARDFAPALAAEYLALVDAGVPALSAAVIVGTRWKVGA